MTDAEKYNLNDDNLESWAQEGLEAFQDFGDIKDVESSITDKVEQRINHDNETIKPWASKLRFLIPLTAIAASFLLIFIFGKDKEKYLYNQYYVEVPHVFEQSVRGNNNQVKNNNLQQGILSYYNKEYKKAIRFFTKVNDKSNAQYLLYYGITQLQLDDFTESITALNKINDSEIKDVKNWYLSLAYLKAKKYPSCKKILNEIINTPNHYKKNQAKALLSQIKN